MKRPQQRTIDALAVALNLTSDDIDECRRPDRSPDDAYTRAYGESAALFRFVARMFGHHNPQASISDHVRFLEEAADSYQTLRGELTALRSEDASVVENVDRIEHALARGHIRDAQELLGRARTDTTTRFAEPVRQLVQLRTMEARVALFAQDADAAANHFATALRLLVELDPTVAADTGTEFIRQLLRHGAWFGGSAHCHAVRLARELFEATASAPSRHTHAIVCKQLADALARLAVNQASPDRTDTLHEAIDLYENALGHFEANDEAEYVATTLNNLGIVWQDLGETLGAHEGPRAFEHAIAAFERSLDGHEHRDDVEKQSETQNNLGCALHGLARLGQGADVVQLLNRAVDAFEESLLLRSLAAPGMEWASTKNNMGNALLGLAECATGAARAGYLKRAIDAYQQALIVRKPEEAPVLWAETQSNLGTALQKLGADNASSIGLETLRASVRAQEAALKVASDRALHRDWWSMVMNSLATSRYHLAERTTGAEKRALLEQATADYEAILMRLPQADASLLATTVKDNLSIMKQALGAE